MAYAKDTRHPGRRREEVMENQRRNYGALNAIGGFARGGRYVYSGADGNLRAQLDPIYRGPCPPNPNGTDYEDVYAAFYQEGELAVNEESPTVTSADGITFYRLELNTTALISEEGIVKERTRVLVLDPGIYAVSYEFNVPEAQTASGTLALLYDRRVVPAMVTDFHKTFAGTAAHYSAMSLISVNSDGAELILGSTSQFTFNPAGFAPVVTLTIFSIA